MSNILKIVKVVQAVRDSKTRIFIETPFTFYSKLDEWLYVEINDSKLCELCDINANRMENGIYRGNHIRAYFPEHEIFDDDTIKVYEHPNCRCVLVRVAKTKELFKKMVET